MDVGDVVGEGCRQHRPSPKQEKGPDGCQNDGPGRVKNQTTGRRKDDTSSSSSGPVELSPVDGSPEIDLFSPEVSVVPSTTKRK